MRGSDISAALFSFGSRVEVSSLALALLGFSLAPVYPCLMATTPRRLGADIARHAFGFQVSAATLGAAVVPAVAGLLVEQFGLEVVGVFTVVLATTLWGLHEVLVGRG
jgi:fucose permease